MSRQPEEFGDFRSMIHQGYLECEFPKFKAGYQRYVIMGGEAGQDAYRSWIDGNTEPQATNLAILFLMMNTRLTELGKEAWLPKLPIPGRLGGDGVTAPAPGTKAYMAWFNNHRLAPALIGLPDLESVA